MLLCYHDYLGFLLHYHYCYYLVIITILMFLTNPDTSGFLNYGTTMKKRVCVVRFVLSNHFQFLVSTAPTVHIPITVK